MCCTVCQSAVRRCKANAAKARHPGSSHSGKPWEQVRTVCKRFYTWHTPADMSNVVQVYPQSSKLTSGKPRTDPTQKHGRANARLLLNRSSVVLTGQHCKIHIQVCPKFCRIRPFGWDLLHAAVVASHRALTTLNSKNSYKRQIARQCDLHPSHIVNNT